MCCCFEPVPLCRRSRIVSSVPTDPLFLLFFFGLSACCNMEFWVRDKGKGVFGGQVHTYGSPEFVFDMIISRATLARSRFCAKRQLS